MQASRIFKHYQSEKCNKSTERLLRRRDVEMAAMCGEMELNLDGDKGDERVENVPTLRYLRQPLDQGDDDWPAVQQNIMRTSSVWGKLGTLILWEVADPKVLESFYRALMQEILLYGSETWVLLASMANRIEGTHTELM